MKDTKRIPNPHPTFRRRRQQPNIGTIAMRWAPVGNGTRARTATLALFAGQLIDAETGKAYSADELVTTTPDNDADRLNWIDAIFSFDGNQHEIGLGHDNVVGQNSVTIGNKLDGSDTAVCIGYQTTAGQYSVSIGKSALSYDRGIAIGFEARAYAHDSTVIGRRITTNYADRALFGTYTGGVIQGEGSKDWTFTTYGSITNPTNYAGTLGSTPDGTMPPGTWQIQCDASTARIFANVGGTVRYADILLGYSV